MTRLSTTTSEIKPNSLEDKTPEIAEVSEDTIGDEFIFKAIGIIRGVVNFTEGQPTTVTIGQKQYPLFYASRNRSALTGLQQEVEKEPNSTQRLIVYPKVIHFPKKNQAPKISFQLVGFDRGREPNGISQYLEDNEFKLAGLWQFIPVCRVPCISIFRNRTEKLLKYLDSIDNPGIKVKALKASHIPVLWKDSPVKPFRFNPKNQGEKKIRAFVQIKAVFLPHRDAFGFVALLGVPTENPPKFLKPDKKDPAQLQQKSGGQKSPQSSQQPRKKSTPSPKKN